METTRVAIGTSDGESVCGHLARSAAFVVVEVEGGEVRSGHMRVRATDQCGNHKAFTEVLAGCSAVVCGGIGTGAYEALVRARIRPLVLKESLSLKQAVSGFLAGTLPLTDERVCLCGPHETERQLTLV